MYLLSLPAKPATQPDPASLPLGTPVAPPRASSGNERAKGQAAWVHQWSRVQGA